MNLDFSLNLTQEQKLIMTQQMQLSVKLLQMSGFELQEYIEKELQENPILDGKYEKEEEPKVQDRMDYKELIKYLEFDNYGAQSYGDYNDDEVSPFNFISEIKSLKEYLDEQVTELNVNEYTKALCKYIIENLDKRGYLDMSINDISKELKVPLQEVEDALEIVQSLEPSGIGGRDLKECLKIQLINRGIDTDNLFKIIDNHLENLGDNKYAVIAKDLKITPKDAQDLGDIIKTLEPKPSRGFFTGEDVKYIVPDAQIRKIAGKYHVIMNEEMSPRLAINNVYKEILTENKDKDAVDYIKGKMNSALFLMKSVDHRKSTIHKVLEKIIDKQQEFLDKGEAYLKPMTLKEIGDEIGVHESTVSRAVRDKYVYIPRGTMKIKDFFTTKISNDDNEDVSVVNIKNAIKKLVDEEDKKKPLSDQVICEKLNELDMNISRRTVAKYREELGIKSSSKRKRL